MSGVMTAPLARAPAPLASDSWAWWQARRLRYNLALAAAGILAYAVFLLLPPVSGLGRAVWPGEFVSQTLLMGLGYLVLMGGANIAYLLGPLMEAWTRPADLARYRRSAWRMGLLGSLAVPFLLPVSHAALLIG